MCVVSLAPLSLISFGRLALLLMGCERFGCHRRGCSATAHLSLGSPVHQALSCPRPHLDVHRCSGHDPHDVGRTFLHLHLQSRSDYVEITSAVSAQRRPPLDHAVVSEEHVRLLNYTNGVWCCITALASMILSVCWTCGPSQPERIRICLHVSPVIAVTVSPAVFQITEINNIRTKNCGTACGEEKTPPGGQFSQDSELLRRNTMVPCFDELCRLSQQWKNASQKFLLAKSPRCVKFEDNSHEETERQQRYARSKAWNLARHTYKLKKERQGCVKQRT